MSAEEHRDKVLGATLDVMQLPSEESGSVLPSEGCELGARAELLVWTMRLTVALLPCLTRLSPQPRLYRKVGTCL